MKLDFTTYLVLFLAVLVLFDRIFPENAPGILIVAFLATSFLTTMYVLVPRPGYLRR